MSDLNATLSSSGNLTAQLGAVVVDGASVNISKTGSTAKMTVTKGSNVQQVTWSDGAKGDKGSSGVYVGSGTMPSDCNVQIDPDGTAVDLTKIEKEVAVQNNASTTKVSAGKVWTSTSNGAGWSDVSSASSSASTVSKSFNVYCWGDSKTEGVGGWEQNIEQVYWQIKNSYPDFLGKSFNVINCGARGESIFTIMARQGTDPMVVNNITIPASRTPVVIGTLTKPFNPTEASGIATKGGHIAKPLVECEPDGFNPVTIAGIEGTIYRELKSTLDTDGSYNYYFLRSEAGTEKAITTATEIETYAMKHYRNDGVAVIWMGANGGFTSHTDAVAKIKSMVEYGCYQDYVVIFHNEFDDTYIQQMKSEFGDHLLYLREELPTRGYLLAGLSVKNIDTSGWSTSDAVLKQAPYMMQYLSGQSGENAFSTLHYSPWGYRAIAKLLEEKINAMNIQASDISGGGTTPAVTGDDYGTYLYKLANAKQLTGTTAIDTKVKLYDSKDKNWSVVCVYDGATSRSEEPYYPHTILSCNYDGGKGLLARYYSATGGLHVKAGSGDLDSSNDGNAQWDGKLNRDGLNVLIFIKNGDYYSLYLNGGLAYGAALKYAVTTDDENNLTLIAGARYSAEGVKALYTKVDIKELIVYDDAITNAAALEITSNWIS